MSTATSGDPPGGRQQKPELTSVRDQQQAGVLGLTSATGLVIGTVIGAGVFTMPAVLASAGTSSLITLGVIALGAMVLAILFGQLTRRVPNSDGGLYAYARYEFGDFAGYLTGWCYWIQAWAGNAAIAQPMLSRILRLKSPRTSGGQAFRPCGRSEIGNAFHGGSGFHLLLRRHFEGSYRFLWGP